MSPAKREPSKREPSKRGSVDPLCQPKASDERIRACILAFAEEAEHGLVHLYTDKLITAANGSTISCAEIARAFQEIVDLRTAVAGFMADDK